MRLSYMLGAKLQNIVLKNIRTKNLTHGNLILQKQFLHFRTRLNCDIEQNCLCHVVEHT